MNRVHALSYGLIFIATVNYSTMVHGMVVATTVENLHIHSIDYSPDPLCTRMLLLLSPSPSPLRRWENYVDGLVL